ncbi:unnamed protein product [Boreogadus saida]
MSNAEVSRILRDLASEMERRPPESVAAVETPSTSAPTLARHPVDGSYATETLFTPPVNRTDLRYDLATGAEVCRIFAPYAGRTPGNRNRCTTTARRRSSYTRSYFCLDNTDQMVVPTRGEKETLNAAGLGEQRLTFLGDEDSAEEFKCHILTAYPKLNDCGGFELLKVSGMTRSKKLSVMPCPSTGYTIKSIKNHIKSATIYIRPMQKDIDTTPVEPESVVSGPKEKCLICAEEIFFSELKDHVKHCRSASEISRASPNMSPPDSQEFCYIASVSTSNSFEVDIDQSSTDAATLQRIDLTEDEPMLESLDEWRSVRSQQDQEYQESLLADQEKHDLQKKSSEMEERRKKILFDFVGEEEDATEYFHIQDALSVTTLNSNMSGSLLENNISGSKTLYVHWIQTDDPEFVPALDSTNQVESPNFNNQFTWSPLPSPMSSPGHDGSFSPEGTDLGTILNLCKA